MMKMPVHASELSKRSLGLSSTQSPYAMLANPIGKMSLSKVDLCVPLEMKKKIYRSGKTNKQETIQGMICICGLKIVRLNLTSVLYLILPSFSDGIHQEIVMSYFNFQWTKTLFQNNLKHIAFFFLQFPRAMNVSYL